MKRYWRVVVASILGMSVLVGCQWTVTNGNTGTSSPVAFTTLSAAGLVVPNHRLQVVQDATAWLQLWTTYAPGITPPTVNFTTQTVLAAFRGASPNTGYGIAIEAVDDLGTTTAGFSLLQVSVGLSEPQPGMVYAAVLIHPAHIVVINRVAQEVTFVEVMR